MVMKLPKERKNQMVGRLQEYYLELRDEEIGALQAEFLLDFMLAELEPVIYNQAMEDAIRTVGEKMLALEEDLHALEKPAVSRR